MFNPGWHLAQELTSMLTVSEQLRAARWLAKRAAALTAVISTSQSRRNLSEAEYL